MEFDFNQIAVPFRMQPGLQRLEGDGPWLTPLAPASALAREKRAVVEAGVALHQVDGFDLSDAIYSIANYDHSERTTGQFDTKNPFKGPSSAAPDAAPTLALRYEEDMAILDGETGTLPWLCVCVPSHWAPEDKLGLPFGAVHAPVADSAPLAAAAAQLVRLVTGGEVWQRWVWTITPSGRYDQHPRRTARAPWPDATDTTPDPATDTAPDPAASPAADTSHLAHFARQCWLRVERQRFLPVRAPDGTLRRQAIFAIRVMLQPLPDAVQSRVQAQRLHDSLASMTDAVLDYKNLRAARAPLLRWLREWRPAC